MALLTTMNARAWNEWLESRPPAIRDLACRFPPNKLYRLKSSGHRVTIASYEEHEDGTVGFRVNVGGDYNCVAFERSVFGIPADGLEECALPGPAELLGSADMSVEEARAAMRWEDGH